jgi:predicted RNase H-like HicB family nuclease
MSDPHRFTAVYEQTDDGWFHVHVPELPEVQTEGHDLEEAREMVRDAIAVALDLRRKRGKPIPATGVALTEQVEVPAA